METVGVVTLKDYPAYQISEAGEVFSKGKPLFVDNSGRPGSRYKSVRLYKDGARRKCLVHRLVFETFLGQVPEGFQVDHIDGDRFNNSVTNLQAISSGDNLGKKRSKYRLPVVNGWLINYQGDGSDPLNLFGN